MPHTIIHQATSNTSWRILSLLRLGERRIYVVKRALNMTESAFSHALRRLERKGLVVSRKAGREKLAKLTPSGRVLYSNLQTLCFSLTGNDGTSTEDDTMLVALMRSGG